MPSDLTFLDEIGARIRRARTGKRMTLRSLSQKSGLSEAFLSRLERGRVSTSIANLIQITGVLEMNLGELFDRSKGRGTHDRGYVVVRSAQRRPAQEVTATGYTYQPLASGWDGQRMDAFILTFPIRNRADVLTAHEGEEMIYLLQGRIVFRLGNEEIPLQAGDCLYFRSEIPHMGKNVGNVDARALMVTAPGRGPGREFGWWKSPAVRTVPRRRTASSRREG